MTGNHPEGDHLLLAHETEILPAGLERHHDQFGMQKTLALSQFAATPEVMQLSNRILEFQNPKTSRLEHTQHQLPKYQCENR